MEQWAKFFPPQTRVLALPDWQHPRLLIPDGAVIERWLKSSLYPAFRLQARLYRLALRTKVTLAGMPARQAGSGPWAFGDFVHECLPNVTAGSVLLGTPGPASKTIVQCWDDRGRIVAYLKYGESPAARARIRQEARILEHLPADLGPRLLRHGTVCDGEALLITPVDGNAVPVVIPPPEAITTLIERIETPGTALSFDEHPGLDRLHSCPAVGSHLDRLAGRTWPVVMRHGDLAPWNIRIGPDGSIRAFDWEYGSPAAFPLFDVAHYLLQVALLIYRWPPRKAADVTAAFLAYQRRWDVSPREARAITGLAAFQSWLNFKEDGHDDTTFLQQWRQSVREVTA